jgi:hypothetical protein
MTITVMLGFGVFCFYNYGIASGIGVFMLAQCFHELNQKINLLI